METTTGRVKILDKHSVKAEKRRIIKNVYVIGVGFMCLFTSFNGLTNLQSSLFLDDGMGTINAGVIYAAFVLSCSFLALITIHYLGYKWTMVMSCCGYVPWMAANGYGVWWTMTPASIIVGLSAASLWTAQSTYITLSAQRYASIAGCNTSVVINRFFAIFYSIYKIAALTGSMVTSTILQPVRVNGSVQTPSGQELQLCGRNDCPSQNMTNVNLKTPDRTTLWIILGVFITISVTGIFLIGYFVDDIPVDMNSSKRTSTRQLITNLLLATLKLFKNVKLLLLIPLTIFSGVSESTFYSDFNKSFVGCTIGIWNIGFVTMSNAVCCIFVSHATNHIFKCTGRMPLILFSLTGFAALFTTLQLWLTTPDQQYVLYILSGLWGLFFMMLRIVITSLYGFLFSGESEAGFCHSVVWCAVGSTVSFSVSSFLCMSTKLHMMTASLLAALVCYIALEWVDRRSRSSEATAV